MSTSREKMLSRIRSGLQRNGPFLKNLAEQESHIPPAFVHPAEDDLAAQFATELAKLQARPHRCSDSEEALEIIRTILIEQHASEAITWDLEQIELPGLAELLAELGVTRADVHLAGPDRAARLQSLDPAPVCISGADAAIAESGTLVVRAAPGRPRLASLLAPTYIAVVREHQIVRGLGAALAKLKERYGPDLLADSSALALISGPSRTGDIEQTLTLGVHGPREVHVLIVP